MGRVCLEITREGVGSAWNFRGRVCLEFLGEGVDFGKILTEIPMGRGGGGKKVPQ